MKNIYTIKKTIMQVKRVALNIYADEESWTRTQANVQESKILILIFLKREMD